MPNSQTESATLAGAMEQICPKNHGVISLGHSFDLRLGRVHEVMGDAADCFAVLSAAHMSGPIVWIGLGGDVASLAPTALQQFLDPSRLIVTEVMSRKEALWACEQALRTRGAACVVCELQDGPDLRESRRLQIAAEQSGCLGLILISRRAQTSACQTRWECAALADDDASWDWRIIKNKTGNLGAWRVRLKGKDDAPGSIHMVATASV